MGRDVKKYVRKMLLWMLLCVCMLSMHAAAKDVVIVIDPGHGGREAGANRVWSGVEYAEEDLNLKISQYLKAELQTYAGVQVYLTREDDTKTMDRETRIKFAKNKKADALVSIHINSTGKDKQRDLTGAFAAVPSVAGYPTTNQYANTARALGTTILQQLNASVGIKNNGYWLDDELGIILFGMKYKVPSIIIEHCFINNPDDCRKYLKTEAALKQIGVADAQGIAKYYNLKKKGMQSEPEDEGSKDHYVLSGWQNLGGHYYYYDKYGVMQVGVTKINGSFYLLNNVGIRQSGFVNLNGRQYYADSNGKLKLGWQKYKGKKYYFSTKYGYAITGFRKIGNKKYYFDSNGVMQKKWVTMKGKKYYFSKVDGRLLTKYWLKYNGKWYYLNKGGTPYTNTKKKINGKWYKFNKKGICTNKK